MLGDYLLLVQFWIPRAASHSTLRSHHSVDTFIIVLIVRDRGKADFLVEPYWEDVDATIDRGTQLVRLLVILHHGVSADILLGVMKNLLRWFIDRKHSKAARRALFSVKALLKVMLPYYLIETRCHHSQQCPIVPLTLRRPFEVVRRAAPHAFLSLLMILYDLFQRKTWAHLVSHHH